MSNTQGTRWRGKLPIPEHAHPLVRRLIEEANRQKTTITEIANRAGLRRATVGDWCSRRHPNIQNIEAAFNVLDLTLIAVSVHRNRNHNSQKADK